MTGKHAAPQAPTVLAGIVAGDAAANRRDELVRVAARMFRDKGFEGTTIRDIANAVGMRSGSPFYHFANKHELLMAVMEEGLRLGLEQTRAVLDDGTLSAAQQFRRLVRVQYGILHDTGSDFIPVMLYDWRSLPEQYRRRIIELKDSYDAVWQHTLEQLHSQGRLATEPKLARLMILGAINFSATWYRPGNSGEHSVDLDQLADQTVSLVLREAK